MINKVERNRFKTIAEKALKMRSPCIQITPVFSNKLDDWAKLLYYFINIAKKVQDKIGLPFLIDITETGGDKPQCPDSPYGIHEMLETSIGSAEKTISCIHCGMSSISTSKSNKELKEFFGQKLFIEPKPFDDGSNH